MELEFKDRLFELRQEKGLSQVKLAKALGVHPMMISAWERGVNQPNIDSIKMLAKFFGCTAGYLLGIED
ncbi:MAG: helix-turn-helix transcriptional regulator [Firmicutes bacterium]|nr:helix-turn-helix transcriptional regulator [Bacillota bacterium]